MQLIDARELAPGQVIDSDCCVVGSGPAGLTVATALARAGIDVCVVESGGPRPDEQAQGLNALETDGHPLRPDFIHRLRALGGTSGLWAGRCMALDAMDFEPRDWAPGSGWPLHYRDYLRYLGPAADLMRLPFETTGRVTAVPGALPGGVGPGLAGSGLAASGLTSKPALWAKQPLRFWDALGPALMVAPNCRLVHGLSVVGIRLNAAGNRVESLQAAATSGGATHTLRARRFVLATGGIENSRLLLLGTRENPQACWPRAALGRWYMDHPRAVYGRVSLEAGVDLSHFLGRPVRGGMAQSGIGLTPDRQRAGHWLNAYCYLEAACPEPLAQGYGGSVQVMKRILQRGHVGRRFSLSALPRMDDLVYQLTPRELLPHDIYRLYYALRARVRPHRRELVIVNHCEQLPDPDSRITLGDSDDRFGNPLPRVDWRIHPRELETLVALHRALDDWLRQRQLGRLLTDPNALEPAMLFDSSHPIGGTRISEHPSTGVINPDLRVHGVANLYVCGSSTFPTGGSANPTWTIVALALRLAEHLAPLFGRSAPPHSGR